MKRRRHPLSEKKVVHYMYQLCRALDHMHRNGIFHRDVKPENILIKQEILKLGDFGSCRSVYSKQPYTEYISTRWYRAPECLLTDGFYSHKMDLWSAGCVFYEITRAAEKQARGGHRKVAPELLSNKWQISKEGSKQKQSLKQEESRPRRQGPAYLMELPQLKLPGATKLSYSSPALQTVFRPGGSGKVPMLRPLKCGAANQKADAQKDIKPNLKQYHLPTIERKGGGY
uniref:MOK protein kinase n=1 Tax=Pipistrellus kuhlii TaxID=59472 RepID=A0A7J7SFP3_PIPKU|nr:MOK protein kinase [Pipistrellus kuhlii]